MKENETQLYDVTAPIPMNLDATVDPNLSVMVKDDPGTKASQVRLMYQHS